MMTMMSWMEKRIITVLLRQEVAAVKDMRPADVPANQFAYHLGSLVSQGYIKKIDRGRYTLTPSGLKLAGSFSTKELRPQENMKTVIMLYGVTDDGEVTLFRWSRQPYINQVTLPYDRMGCDVSLQDALATACNDKLGAQVDVAYRTNLFVTITHASQVVSRMHALVYAFNPSKITLPFTTRNGELFLADQAAAQASMQGTDVLLTHLRSGAATEPVEIQLSY